MRSGDLLNFSGQQLDFSRDYKLVLDVSGHHIPMPIVSWTRERVTARVPGGDPLEPGQRYPVRLEDKSGRLLPVETALSLRFCPAAAGPVTWPNDVEPNEILALVAPRDEAALLRDAAARGYRLERRNALTALGLVILILEPPASVAPEEALEGLRAANPEAVIDYNSRYGYSAGPRVYAPEAIAWPKAGGFCEPGHGAPAIGIIDGAVDKSHEAFVQSKVEARSFSSTYGPPGPADHGTAVAALLVGSAPDDGFMGLMPFAQLYAADVFNAVGGGDAVASAERVARALDWLLGKNVRLVNLSIAGGNNLVLAKIFESALSRGLIAFAAAGNAGPKAPPAYPAAIDGVIAVTGVDSESHIYGKANHGDYVAFSAPGVDVWSARAGGDGSYHTGTSFASPFAMAVAAQHVATRPTLSRDLLVALMKNGAKDLGTKGRDPVFGWGLVQAEPSCL